MKILRRMVKREIVKANFDLFHGEFNVPKIEWSGAMQSLQAKQIVALFRTKLGYSEKTADCDIFWQARIAYDRYVKGADINKHIIR